ncbi:tRNA-specific adenosine deaminase, partial [Salpingoeca rosetta]
MEAAVAEAQRALAEGEVPVGCVFVDDNGNVQAAGRNQTNIEHNATRHAELVAFDDCVARCGGDVEKAKDIVASCTLYVTVEPCVMCAYALRLLGVTRVVFGCHNDRFGGCGSTMDVATCETPDGLPKLQLEAGPMRTRAINLLKLFYVNENPNAPRPKRKTRRDPKLLPEQQQQQGGGETEHGGGEQGQGG